MVHNGEQALERFTVNIVPCGHCRQFLKEYRNADNVQIHVLTRQLHTNLVSLLPHNFGPKDLNCSECLFSPKTHNFVLDCTAPAALEVATLDCLNSHSHAPYSGAQSAVGIKTKEGLICCGAYLESAAYNPSLPPAQS
jgi:cytidine deaminase